jgi:alpha-beta hydrolase superfamily lysophospholipase
MDTEKQAHKIRNIVYVCPVDHSGTSLFVKGWIAPTPKQDTAPIILIHDIEESSDDYIACAEKLAQLGFNVYAFELRIQTKRTKGASLLGLENFSNDLLQVVAWIKYKESGQKPILVGQGLGSLVCLYFAQHFNKYISAMVFVSPLFSIQETVTPIKRFFIRTLAQIAPYLATPAWLSFMFTDFHKKESKKRKGKLPIYFMHELLMSISRSHKFFSRLSIPTLIVCPGVDPVCRYEFLKRLISKHKNEEKISLVTLDVEGHQILTKGEEILNSVLGILVPWLKVHGNL